MSTYVDLPFDKPRRFQFTPIDARAVCRYLNALPGYSAALGQPVNAHNLLALLAGRDFDAWAAVLGQGLQHEEPSVTYDKAMRLFNDFLVKGGSAGTLATAITEAGMASGVWERAATNQKSDGSQDDAGNVAASALGS